MKELDKIRSSLKGVEPIESGDENLFGNIITGISEPPAYIVQILAAVMKFKIHSPSSEKVTWETFLRYKKQIFMIRDYKFGTWSIEGPSNDESTTQSAKEIKTKITRASKLLDKIISRVLQSQIKKGKFYLNNSYPKLYSFYNFFQEKVLEAINDYDVAANQAKKPTSSSKTPLHGLVKSEDQIAEYIHKKIDYVYTKPPVITNYTFSLMNTFYSLLEFLFNAIYAFEQPRIKFSEFKEKRWEEKFKLLFPVNKNAQLNTFYSNFVKIKKEYRNPLTHGLLEDVGLLVPFPKIGLIPTSYEYISHKIHFPHVHIQKEEACWIMENFKNFLLYLENNDPYRYYILYLNYGFSISMIKKEMSEIKSKMTTFEDFEKYLEDYAKYLDMVANREL